MGESFSALAQRLQIQEMAVKELAETHKLRGNLFKQAWDDIQSGFTAPLFKDCNHEKLKHVVEGVYFKPKKPGVWSRKVLKELSRNKYFKNVKI